MEIELIEANKDERRDMQMDELAAFWEVRHEEFGIELAEREETSCCGGKRRAVQPSS